MLRKTTSTNIKDSVHPLCRFSNNVFLARINAGLNSGPRTFNSNRATPPCHCQSQFGDYQEYLNKALMSRMVHTSCSCDFRYTVGFGISLFHSDAVTRFSKINGMIFCEQTDPMSNISENFQQKEMDCLLFSKYLCT